jgi:bla regulator protein blaR1
MKHVLTDQLDLGNKLPVSIMVAIAVSIVFGVIVAPTLRAQSLATSTAPLPATEIVSVKRNFSGDRMTRIGLLPDRFTVTNVSAKYLIKFAYGVRDYQLSGAPGWTEKDKYDIDLREKGAPMIGVTSNRDIQLRRRLMVQALLSDWFKLRTHTEAKDLSTYQLVVGDDGAKFSATPAPVTLGSARILSVRGHLTMTALPMNALAGELSDQLSCQVVDGTGLSGVYDLQLEWSPNLESKTAIEEALQQELGLKLVPQTGPVQILIVDGIENRSDSDLGGVQARVNVPK